MVGAGAAVGVGLASTIRSAQDAERSQIKLQNTIKNMPQLAGASTKAFNDQAKALQNVTVASDDEVTAAQAMLGTFHLTQEELLALTPLVVDYARKFDTDLVSAAKQVGKAMDGQIGALQRNGILIDKNAFATDRFNTILGALRENAGGFAEREGKTFDGQVVILGNHIDDLKESIGRGALSILNEFLPALNDTASAIGGVDEATGGMIGKVALIGGAASLAVGGVLLAAGAASKAKAAFAEGGIAAGRFGVAIKGIGAAAGAALALSLLVDGLDLVTGNSEKAEAAIRGVIQASSDAAALRIFNDEVDRLTEQKSPKGLLDLVGIGGDLFDQFDRGDIAIRTFNSVLEKSPTAAQALVNAMKRNGQEVGNFQRRIDESVKAQKRAAQVADEDAAAVDRGTTSKERAAAATEQLNQTIEDGARVYDEAAAKTQTYLDAVRAEFDASFAAADAQATLNETMKSGTASFQDRAKAVLDAVAADAAFAVQQLGPGASAAQKAKEGFDTQIESLVKLRNQYPEMAPFIDVYIKKLADQNAASQQSADTNQAAVDVLTALRDKYPELSAPIDALIAKIGQLKGANDTSNTSTQAAISVLRALRDRYPEIGREIDIVLQKILTLRGELSKPVPETVIRFRYVTEGSPPQRSVPGTTGSFRFAAGGPIRKGTFATVAELGPELFVPNAAQRYIQGPKMRVTGSPDAPEKLQADLSASATRPVLGTGSVLKSSVEQPQGGTTPVEVPPGILYLGAKGQEMFVPPVDGTIIPANQVDETLEKLGLDPKKVPKRATGGRLKREQYGLVGEQGIELFWPDSAGPVPSRLGAKPRRPLPPAATVPAPRLPAALVRPIDESVPRPASAPRGRQLASVGTRAPAPTFIVPNAEPLPNLFPSNARGDQRARAASRPISDRLRSALGAPNASTLRQERSSAVPGPSAATLPAPVRTAGFTGVSGVVQDVKIDVQVQAGVIGNSAEVGRMVVEALAAHVKRNGKAGLPI